MDNSIDDYKKDSLVDNDLLQEQLIKIRSNKAWKHVFDKENYSKAAIDKLFKELVSRKKALEKTFKKDSLSYKYFKKILEQKEKESFNFVFEDTDRLAGVPSNYIMYDSNTISFLKDNYFAIQWASNDVKNNKSEMLKFLSWNPLEYKYLENVSPINGDRDICRIVLREVPSFLKIMPNDIKKDKELTTLAVESQIVAYKSIDTSLKNDYEYILNLVKVEKSGLLYEFLNSDFKREPLIIEAAINIFWHNYISMEDDLKCNKRYMLLYLNKGGGLSCIPDIMFKENDLLIEMLERVDESNLQIKKSDIKKLLNNEMFKKGIEGKDTETDDEILIRDIFEKGTIYLKREYLSQEIKTSSKHGKRLKF